MKVLSSILIAILFVHTTFKTQAAREFNINDRDTVLKNVEKLILKHNFDWDAGLKTYSSPDSIKYREVVSRRYWVNDYHPDVYLKPSRDIEKFSLGLYYLGQNLQTNPLWDTMGRRSFTHGFSLQCMSGNLFKGEVLALYGGLEWGMQFYGRSSMDTVVINSENLDRAFIYMNSYTNDFTMRWQLEYAMKHWAPYIGFGLGARLFTTVNTVEGILPSTEYLAREDQVMDWETALMRSFSIGSRFKISPRSSFDIRFEQSFGQTEQLVNYNSTSFNGMEYNVRRNSIDLGSHQWRLGFVFDLSIAKDKDTLIPAHVETETMELMLGEYDAKRIIPCTDVRKNPKAEDIMESNQGETEYTTEPYSIGKNSDSLQFYKSVQSRTTDKEVIKYRFVAWPENTERGRFSAYYSFQSMQNKALWDSMGRRKMSHGFTFQLLSQNLFKNDQVAFCAGIEWGMLFYGANSRDTFLMNLNPMDLGKSRMRSYSNDILALGILSFKNQHVGPYLMAGFGTRLFKTVQHVDQINYSNKYDANDYYRVGSGNMFMAKFGVGSRIKVTKDFYVDVRRDWNFTTQADIVNYRNTTFDGSQYRPQSNKMNMNSGQWQIGMSFRVNDGYRVEERRQPSYVSSEKLYINTDSTYLIIPCTQEQSNHIIPEKREIRSYRPSTPVYDHTPSVPNEPQTESREERPVRQTTRGSTPKTAKTPKPAKQEFPGLTKPTKKIEN